MRGSERAVTQPLRVHGRKHADKRLVCADRTRRPIRCYRDRPGPPSSCNETHGRANRYIGRPDRHRRHHRRTLQVRLWKHWTRRLCGTRAGGKSSFHILLVDRITPRKMPTDSRPSGAEFSGTHKIANFPVKGALNVDSRATSQQRYGRLTTNHVPIDGRRHGGIRSLTVPRLEGEAQTKQCRFTEGGSEE